MPGPTEYTIGDNLIPPKFKVAMVVMTIFSIIAGLLKIVYSLYTIFVVISPTEIVSAYLTIPLMMLIFLGLMMPFFSFIGCRGVIKEKLRPLRVCYISMGVILLLTFILAVYTCASTFTSNKRRNFPIEQAIISYHDDMELAEKINRLQRKLQCCGMVSITDWNNNLNFFCDVSNYQIMSCNLPSSCCINNGTMPIYLNCGENALNDTAFRYRRRENVINMQGCQEKIDELLVSIALQIVALAIFLSVIEISILKLSLRIKSLYRKHCQERCNPPVVITENNLHATTSL